MSVYADTSFVVSLYVADSKSNDAATLMAKLPKPVLLSALGEFELLNAFHLDLFRKEILGSDLRAAVASFQADVASKIFTITPLSESMFSEARRLAARWTPTLGSRSLDILQVAAAIVLKADVFVTFDERQKKLAKAAGLVCR